MEDLCGAGLEKIIFLEKVFLGFWGF